MSIMQIPEEIQTQDDPKSAFLRALKALESCRWTLKLVISNMVLMHSYGLL